MVIAVKLKRVPAKSAFDVCVKVDWRQEMSTCNKIKKKMKVASLSTGLVYFCPLLRNKLQQVLTVKRSINVFPPSTSSVIIISLPYNWWCHVLVIVTYWVLKGQSFCLHDVVSSFIFLNYYGDFHMGKYLAISDYNNTY